MYLFMHASVRQVLQTCTQESDVGSVNGVQSALISVFYLMSYMLEGIFPDPDDFIAPALISTGFVALATMTFTIFHLRHTLSQQNFMNPAITIKKALLDNCDRGSGTIAVTQTLIK
jgi:predicted membrane-bound spermidine synthase